MEAYLSMAKMPPCYYAAAVLLGLAVGLWKRRWVPGLLAAYAFFVFSLALLARSGPAEPRWILRFLWSYEDWPRGCRQVLANVAVFVPLGFLLGRLAGWRAVPIGAGFSVLIELLQLVTGRGVFEFDDMFHNALGTLLGAALAVLLTRRGRKLRRDE